MHDKLCADYDKLTLTCTSPGDRQAITILAKSGLEGLKIPGATIHLPFKKPKGEELTDLEKNQNKIFSRFMVSIENAIRGVKRLDV